MYRPEYPEYQQQQQQQRVIVAVVVWRPKNNNVIARGFSMVVLEMRQDVGCVRFLQNYGLFLHRWVRIRKKWET